MTRHFRDYVWKKGTPHGRVPVEGKNEDISYKIVADPYGKRISIEKYRLGIFDSVVYDSLLLDFRTLNPVSHSAWQTEPLEAAHAGSVYLIRNQDDRLLFKETYVFQGNLCRECHIASAHGIPLSCHKIFYESLNDPFNGVILYDTNWRTVMIKKYEPNPLTGEFETLIEENWDCEGIKIESDLGPTS